MSLLQEILEKTREVEFGGDSDKKEQALLLGKYMLEETGYPVGTKWEDIPSDVRNDVVKTLKMALVDAGLDPSVAAVGSRTRAALYYDLRLPEALAMKLLEEATRDSKDMNVAEKQRRLALLQNVVATGVPEPTVPDYVNKRILDRVRKQQVCPVVTADWRVACGKRDYLVGKVEDEEPTVDEATDEDVLQEMVRRAEADPRVLTRLITAAVQTNDRVQKTKDAEFGRPLPSRKQIDHQREETDGLVQATLLIHEVETKLAQLGAMVTALALEDVQVVDDMLDQRVMTQLNLVLLSTRGIDALTEQ